jgi:HAD superfamily hydrolase (TIGR01458 family)
MARNDYALLIDLDGVLYQENELIAGAPETVAWIESQEIDYLFITNTTSKSRAALVKKCARMDLKVDSSRIITPIVAASRWLKAQSIHSAALFVKAGAIEDFSGVTIADIHNESLARAVVIGDLGKEWSYTRLNTAFRLLMQEPEPVLIALGMTRYWRGKDGLNLDVAPFIKALEYAADCRAKVIGKPSRSFFNSALDLLGYEAANTVMIGDDIVSDVDGARNAGIRGLLVKTGKFRESDLDSSIEIDGLLDSFADLPAWWEENVGGD